MAHVLLTLESLKFPTEYVRGRINPGYVKQLEGIARNAMQTDGKKLDPSRWPFPAIEVRALPIEMYEAKEKQKQTDPKTKKVKTVTVTVQKPGPQFYVVDDGQHRTRAAKALEMATIPAVIVKRSEKEAAMAQLVDNLRHGLFLDKDARDAWIKHLVKEMKFSLRAIVKETDLSLASVSRIVAGRQRKPAGEPRKKAKRGARVPTGEWSPKVFKAQLESLSKEYAKHADEITKYRDDSEAAWKISDDFQDFVHGLAPGA
jgi:transcriptional regulator with XRE-family HTH domain